MIKSEGLRRYAANTGWLLGEQVSRFIAVFVGGLLVARYLGPSDFGILSFALSFVGLFMFFGTLGMFNVLGRDLVKFPEQAGVIVATSFTMMLTASFGVFLLVLAVAWVFVGHSRGFDLIAVISAACLFQFFFVVDAFFQSKVKGKVTSIARSLAFLVSTVFKIFLIWIEAPLIYFAVALMLDTALVGLFHGIAFLRFSRLDFGTLRVRSETAKHLLSESWPFILSGASMAVYVKIDVVMIQWLLTEYDVGQYVGAARISEAVYFVPGAITSALYPAIVNAKQKSVDLYKSRLSNLYSFLFFASLAYAACLALLSGPIIHILLGQQYLEATSVLVLHVWASIFVFLGYANSKWLLTEGLQIYFAANTAIGAVVNVLLNLILVPLYSIEGAAIATVISYAVSAYLSMLIWPKTRENFYLLSRSMIANPLKINLNPKAA